MDMIIIVAADESGGIGKDGKIPWHLRKDLQRFKRYTTGNVVVMGRKTYDSIGHALPDRTNVVITKNADISGADLITNTPDNIPSLKTIFPDKDIFIIGGEGIYNAMWEQADYIYMTRVHAFLDCDKFIPQIPEGYILVRSEEVEKDENNDFPTTFEIWRKKRKSQVDRLLRK